MPEFRTGDYAIWCACERFGILPPDIKSRWDDNGVMQQALLIAFDQVRGHDDFERQAALAGAKVN